MTPPPVGGASPRDPGRSAPADIAARFAQLASAVEAGRPEAVVTALLEEAEASCRRGAQESRGETASLLANLTQALKTWREVYPRMGRQREFRLAVCREAGMWSRRLEQAAATGPAAWQGKGGGG